MLTIFAIPKAFEGPVAIIQRNAIRSWCSLRPACEIILFGDDAGTADVASEFNIRHVPVVERNKYGTPLVNALFAAAQRIASHSMLCYVNADIILMTDFMRAVAYGIKIMPDCLMICRRWDVSLNRQLDFRADWEHDLGAYVARQGRRRPHTAIDCFVFSRGLWTDIPPFAMGRGMWDNWLIYKARANRRPVIDLSDVVLVVHQNHDYAHQVHGVRREAEMWSTEEAKCNLAIGGGYAHAFSTYDATHRLTSRGLKRNITPYHLYRALALLARSRPFVAPLVDVMRYAYSRYNAMRRLCVGRTRH